jgi:ATPase subunit of ABC transporter with duplicated ATPase domains
MLRVRAEGLCFAFNDAALLIEEASFTLDAGFTGLVGANGSGKTTLLRLIAGALRPTAGFVRVEPRAARVVWCEQEVQDASDDVRAFGACDSGSARRLRGVLRLTPFEDWAALSPGERKRWQVATALALEPDVLLLDEPTNHLDAVARQWLSQALSQFTGIGIVVSHERVLLNELTSRTLRVHDSDVTLYTGAYDVAKQTWESEEQRVLAGRKQAKERVRALTHRLHEARIAQRSATLQRSSSRRMRNPHDSDARGVLAKTKAEWAESTHGRKVEVVRRELSRATRQLEHVTVEKPLGSTLFARFAPASSDFIAYRPAAPVTLSGRALIAAPAVGVRATDRVWITGPNGAGKTTLLRALLEALRVPCDQITVVPQELEPADVQAALAGVREMSPNVRGQVLSVVAALGVDPARLLASATPSPGEARKLTIALGLGREVKAILLDEPTNHLDLPSIERLQCALVRYPGALVLITHDETLGRACTSTRWHVEQGTLRVEAGS